MTAVITLFDPRSSKRLESMPAKPSSIQSFGTPETYTWSNGRTVEVRQGNLYFSGTREFICGADETAEQLLKHGRLSAYERDDIENHKQYVWPTCGMEQLTRGQVARMHS